MIPYLTTQKFIPNVSEKNIFNHETTEQESLCLRLSAISSGFVRMAKEINFTAMMLHGDQEGFIDLQQHFQPQLLDQISASLLPILVWIGIMISYLKSDFENLESINTVAAGTE